MARYHESLDQTKEKIGEALLPALQSVLTTLQPLFAWLANNTAILSKLAPILAIAAGAVIAVNVAMKAWAAIQAVVNLLLDANPIGLVVLAIAALIAVVILVVRHWTDVKNIVSDVWQTLAALGAWITGHWKVIVDILLGPLGLLLTNLGLVKGVVQDLEGALRDVGKAASDALGWLGKIPHSIGSVGSVLGSLNPFAASATVTGAPPVSITIYATPGDDLPETVYQALKTYQRRHVRPELAPMFTGAGW